MRELFTMWRNTRMIVLTAICAAAYVAVLLPFKGLVIIPGLTEVRPGAAIPVVLSFLFGPAAAWGAGLGNLIADLLGGMFGPGSLFGFLGNFMYGYVPYAMWRALMGTANPLRSGVRGALVFAWVLVVNCLVIGSVIGWGADLLKLAPFGALGLIIAVNDLIASATIATILIALLYNRVAAWGLLYGQILDETPETFGDDEVTAPPVRRSKLAVVGALLLTVGACVAFFTGLFISAEALSAGYGAAGFASQAKGSMAVAGGMAPGLILLFIGALLL